MGSVSIMLQQVPIEVTGWVIWKLDGSDGIAQLSQNPRQAFVTISNETQSLMLTLLVWPSQKNLLEFVVVLIVF